MIKKVEIKIISKANIYNYKNTLFIFLTSGLEDNSVFVEYFPQILRNGVKFLKSLLEFIYLL